MIREYRIKSVPAQFLILRKHFPELGSPDFELTLSELRPYAEGWWRDRAGRNLHPPMVKRYTASSTQSSIRRRNLSSGQPRASHHQRRSLASISRVTNIPLKVDSRMSPTFIFDAHKNSDSIRRCSVTRLARLLRRSFWIYGPLGK